MQAILKDIRKMVVFAQVVADGSFTRAAQSLNLGKASVSEHVSQLELELKVTLLNRSTRRISLTEAGEIFYSHCQQVIEQARAAHESVSRLSELPGGKLRISTTVDFSVFHLTPILAQFRQKFPDIQLEMVLDDGITDLVAEQIDLAIRIGKPEDLSYRYRPLKKFQLVMVAGKEYLATFGTPKTLADLHRHQWLSLTLQVSKAKLTGYKNGQRQQVAVTPAYSSNSPMLSHTMVKENLGIAMLPEYTVKHEIQVGNMVRVLSDYEFVRGEVFILYPNSPQVPAKTRAFIDYLLEKISPE